MQKNYISPLVIPEGTSGKYKVVHRTHPAGKPIPLINARTAIFSGQRRHDLVYDGDVVHRYLEGPEGTWMSDVPQEQYQADELIKKICGRVLVGGLGLGYVATRLADRLSVDEIIVVEKSKDIIKLVWEHLNLNGKGKIVHGDIFDYLKKKHGKFDYVYLDIWQSDGEHTLLTTVLPLRILSRRLVESEDKIICWNEDVMRGQVEHGISMRLQFDPEKMRHIEKDVMKIMEEWDRLEVPFWRWFMETKPDIDTALIEARRYVHELGTRAWFKEWKRYIKGGKL